VEFAVEAILDSTLQEARANELLQFVEDFGVNHSVLATTLPLEVVLQAVDDVPAQIAYEEDTAEPSPGAPDAWAEAPIRQEEAFDVDNMVNTAFLQLP